MPPPSSEAQAATAVLASELGQQVLQAFPRLDVNDLRGSLPSLSQLITALLHRFGRGAGTIAARQYTRERQAVVRGTFTVQPAPLPTLQQVHSTVKWATQPLWSAIPDVESAQANLVAGAEKMLLDVARDTIIDNSQRDRKARGWARVTEPDPCYFCALIATRGAAYKVEKQANFLSHDHCRCHAEPVFGEYEPPAEVRQWQADYRAATRGVRGTKNLQLAWRQAYEGRTAPSK